MSSLSLYQAIRENDYQQVEKEISKMGQEDAEDALLVVIDSPWECIMEDGHKIYDKHGVNVGWQYYQPELKVAAAYLKELSQICSLLGCVKNVPTFILETANSHLAQASERVANIILEGEG